MGRRVIGAVLPVVVSLFAGACGYRDPSRESQARATAQTFIASCARDRPAAAMQVLTQPLRDSFVRAGPPATACARFLGIAPGPRTGAALLRVLQGVSVVAVDVRGSAAIVRLAAPAAPPAEVSLEFTEGEWKVDSPPAV